VPLVVLLSGAAQAFGSEAKPQIEWGLGGAAINSSAYPSSSVNIQRQFVLPWFIYRGDSVQVKDGGIKLIAYESDRLLIDLGLGGSLNADTSETPIRDGMPDIDFLFELGPQFNFSISDHQRKNWRNRVNWVSAYRFALSTDLRRLDYRGPVATTELRYRKDSLTNNKVSFEAELEATWAGNGLMDYFFAVDPEFETDTRPQFSANAGYLGLDLSLGLQYEFSPALSAFASIGVTNYAGSRNEDSPLFEDENNARVFLAVIWRLYASEAVTKVVDE